MGFSKAEISYINTVVAFDIETTSYTDNDEKRAIVYSYCVAVEDEIHRFRTAVEFVEFMSKLTENYFTSLGERLVIWVHNLSYEWQFIKRLFTWSEGFAKDTTNIVRAVTVDGLEFRCSYSLTNLSLAEVGRQVGVSKAVGDLDYHLTRHGSTTLTAAEIGYIEDDVRIIVALIREKLTEDSFATMPMTKTGYVRRDVLKATRSDAAYRKVMNGLQLDAETYHMARTVYQGGYVHANGEVVGSVLSDVVAYDLSSSYPASIAQFQYPMSMFTELDNIDTMGELEAILDGNCAIIDIEFHDVETRYPFPITSESRTISTSFPLVDNGRIFSAESMRVLITEVDYWSLKRCYSFEGVTIYSVHVARSDYLPKQFVEPILDLYRTKTIMKGVSGQETVYRIAKENINSVYGMIGTDPIKESHELRDCIFEPVETDLLSELDKYNKSRKRFLYYPWGAWVTAYSRSVLTEAIFDMIDAGVIVAYCDTDSIYAVDHSAIPAIIKRANDDILARLMEAMDHHGYDQTTAKEFISPLDKNGHPHPLGVFECETPTPLVGFKTLGAKRYAKLDHNERFGITVSGLRKKASEYVNERGGFDFFTDGMTIPAEYSGRLTHTYSEEHIKNILIDYNGVPDHVEQHGFIHLEPSAYHMSLGADYQQFLTSMPV